jgi:hypothetical protein
MLLPFDGASRWWDIVVPDLLLIQYRCNGVTKVLLLYGMRLVRVVVYGTAIDQMPVVVE